MLIDTGKKYLISFAAGLFIAFNLAAQDTLSIKPSGNNSNSKTVVVIAGSSIVYACGWLYANDNWYPGSQKVPFFFTNDFHGYLQVDKFQHSFGSYYESYALFHLLRNAGFKRNKALIWCAPMGLLVQSPKEFIDGRHEGGGFSWSDISANFTGSAFFVAQELIFGEQVLKFKFSFSKSAYEDESYGYFGSNIFQNYFKDYNGHSYWLTLSANRLILKDKLPSWVGVSAGYSANGMFGQYRNVEKYHGYYLPETKRYRQFLLSLDIDWPRIKTRSRFLKTVLNAMVFIKLPFPALELNSMGRLRGYWLYF